MLFFCALVVKFDTQASTIRRASKPRVQHTVVWSSINYRNAIWKRAKRQQPDARRTMQACEAVYLSPSTTVTGSLVGHRRRSAASALGCRPSLSRFDNDELQPKAEGETARCNVARTMAHWKRRRRQRWPTQQLPAWQRPWTSTSPRRRGTARRGPGGTRLRAEAAVSLRGFARCAPL